MKKLTLSFTLFMVLSLLSCGTDFTVEPVEPSGYENIDNLNQCIAEFNEPDGDDYCTELELREEIQDYAEYFLNQFEDDEDSNSVHLSTAEIHRASESQAFYFEIYYDINETYSYSTYEKLELIYFQITQEILGDLDISSGITIEIYLEESSLLFSRLVNGNQVTDQNARKIGFNDETKSTSELFSDAFDNYLSNGEDKIFTRTIFALHSINDIYVLDINHKDKEFSYIAIEPVYSYTDFQTLIETFLPKYTKVNFTL